MADEKKVAAELTKKEAEGILIDEFALDSKLDGEEVTDEKLEEVIKSEKKRLSAQEKRKAEQKQIQEKIEKLLERNKQLQKELQENRSDCLDSFIGKLHVFVISELGLKKEEKDCFTEPEFDALLEKVKEKMALWKNGTEPLKYECMIPGYEKVCDHLGLKDELSACKTKDQYRDVYKKVNNKMKSLLAAKKEA